MADEPKFLKLLVIVLFSSGIVLIGAHELRHRFQSKQGSKSAKELVRQLHGEIDPMRASISRSAVEDSALKKEHSDEDKSQLQDMLEKVLP